MYNAAYHELSNTMKVDGLAAFIGNAIPHSESLGEIGGILAEKFDSSGAAIAEKTSQILALTGVFAAPIVIIFFLFIGKIAYDVFTGAADSIGDAVLITRYKIKVYFKIVFTKIRSLISPGA